MQSAISVHPPRSAFRPLLPAFSLQAGTFVQNGAGKIPLPLSSAERRCSQELIRSRHPRLGASVFHLSEQEARLLHAMDFMPIYEDGDLIVEGTQTEVMPIDEDGDLIVEVTQTGNDPTAKTGSFTGTFRVNSDVMKKASQVFLAMLATARWKESSGSVVSLGENHVAVTELWLRVVHNAKLVHNLLFLEIWYLVQAIDYYALDATLFYPWFASAYAQNSHMLEDKPAQLLFPTWHFNHAKAFAKCTHDLAYGQVRAITEKNPSDIYEYHLPARQIRKLTSWSRR